MAVQIKQVDYATGLVLVDHFLRSGDTYPQKPESGEILHQVHQKSTLPHENMEYNACNYTGKNSRVKLRSRLLMMKDLRITRTEHRMIKY